MSATQFPAGDFSGRCYLVTGSTRGIGRATAAALVQHGASVVVNGRDPDEVGKVRAALGHERCAGVAGSIDDDATVAGCVSTAYDTFGRLDGIVNNVGANTFYGPLGEIPRRRWDRTST